MNTLSEKAANGQEVDRKAAKKCSTTEIPMVDLNVVLEFVSKIESGGLQTLPSLEVAKRIGFAAPTSTPFYRRMVAAKLFGLLDTTQGVNLTKLALDYFKPTDDESKAAALVSAVKNVVGYQKILDRYSGKRLPQADILANVIEREFNLVPDTARLCANVFVNSVRRAGLLQDGVLVTTPPGQSRPAAAFEAASPAGLPAQPVAAVSAVAATDLESHYLTLDAKRGRRIVLHGPPVITTSELKRIQSWLAVQFHVVEALEDSEHDKQRADGAEASSDSPIA